MILEPGKLYRISRHFWYLFPTSELAVESHVAVADTAADASIGADFASRRIKQSNNKVTFMHEGEGFLVVEVSGTQVKVVNQEGKSGWINFPATQSWTKDTITEASNAP